MSIEKQICHRFQGPGLGMARDRPSPYGGRRGVLGNVARGPVPRDLPT